MKVAIFGGTGFVGSYVVDELLAHDHVPVVLARSGSEDKVRRRDACEVVSGVIEDADAVHRRDGDGAGRGSKCAGAGRQCVIRDRAERCPAPTRG